MSPVRKKESHCFDQYLETKDELTRRRLSFFDFFDFFFFCFFFLLRRSSSDEDEESELSDESLQGKRGP